MTFNILLILIIAGAFASQTSSFVTENEEKMEYVFYDAPSAAEQAFTAFFSFYLLFN